MANEFIARKGLVSSGSVNVSGSVTASFFKGDGSQLTNLPAATVLSSSVSIDTYTFTGDGSTKNYVLSQSYDVSSLFVSLAGLSQTNIQDYTLTGATLSFISAPPASSNILVKALLNVTQNMTGSFSGSFFGILASASYATTASYAANAGGLAGVISSSTQFKTLTDPFTGSFTGSHTGTFPYSGLTGTPTLVSASSQIDYNSIQNKLSGVVSSSAQVQPLLPGGTVSSSAQYPGWVTSSVQINTGSFSGSLTGSVFASTGSIRIDTGSILLGYSASINPPQTPLVIDTSTISTHRAIMLTKGPFTGSYYGYIEMSNGAPNFVLRSSGDLGISVANSNALSFTYTNPNSILQALGSNNLRLKTSNANSTIGTRNQANDRDNLIITDAGDVTITGSLLVKGASGITGSIAATNGVVSGAAQIPALLPGGIVSSSAQYPGWVTSSLQINTGSFSGSITTSSFATTASFALTASYVASAGAAAGTISSSAQFKTLTDPFTGSFTGSFTGNGAGLTNIPFAVQTDNYTFVGDGSTKNYILSQSYDTTSVDIYVAGMAYTNITDYTITAQTASFVSAPPNGSNILIKALLNTANASGSFSGSFMGTLSGVSSSNNILPTLDNTYNLGSPTNRWANLYTGDLVLSNEGSQGNSVDGTTGNWTIQEGEEELFILNNKTGKKYKFMLVEIK